MECITKTRNIISKVRERDLFYLVWKLKQYLFRKIFKVIYAHADNYKSFNINKSNKTFLHSVVNRYVANSNTKSLLDSTGIISSINYLCDSDSSYRQSIIANGDKICSNIISILGDNEKYLGERINWSKDYKSGVTWDSQYAFDYVLLDWSKPSDVRIVWELNRLHFILDLGKAYLVTKDDKYVLKYKEIIIDWQANNKVAYSLAWGCAMEASIRAVNLILALDFFASSKLLDEAFMCNYINSIIQHGHFIWRNIEYADIRGNHYLADLVGLVYIGCYFHEYPESRKWLQFSTNKLEEEIFGQIHPDGVDHEGSLPYQQLVVELLLSAIILLKKNGIVLSSEAMARVENAVEFIMHYTKPDGKCPMFGDSDDGRLHPFGKQDVNDHRHLLSTAAVIFKRGDFKAAAGKFWEDSLWLLGVEGLHEFDALHEKEYRLSRAFDNGGFYVMQNVGNHMIIDCGNVGMAGRGGHGHIDRLSFELFLNGEQLICDTGCSSYAANKTERIAAISSKAHNLTIIKGIEMAAIDTSGFIQARNVPGRTVRWDVGEEVDYFHGQIEFCQENKESIKYDRQIKFYKTKSVVEIIDSFTGIVDYPLETYFHFAPNCRVSNDRGSVAIFSETLGNSFLMETDSSGEWLIEDGVIYSHYAKECPSNVAVFKSNEKFPSTLHFKISSVGKS